MQNCCLCGFFFFFLTRKAVKVKPNAPKIMMLVSYRFISLTPSDHYLVLVFTLSSGFSVRAEEVGFVCLYGVYLECSNGV